MTKSGLIDYAHRVAPVPLRSSSSSVKRRFGKSLAAQASEIWRLRQSFGQLTPKEYYYFGLYDDERFSSEEKERFIGLGVQSQILWRCTDVRWWSIALDKVAFCSFMSSYGFPVLDVQATLHPYRQLASAAALKTRADAANFLRHEARYPLFTKPFDGMRSVGSARINAYDCATDELVVHPDRRVPIEEYLEVVSRYVQSGYLFQSLQHPHDNVRAMCGDRLACVRLVVLVGPGGPEPFRAVWKIPAGANVADNFWRDGNLLAGIDLDTGRVTRVIRGVGTEREDITTHPETGVSFLRREVPDWQQLKSLCLGAASTIPGISVQGWDVAPSQQGPVLVEVNVGGDFTLPQLGTATGMLDDRFRKFLEEHSFQPMKMPPWGFHLWPALRSRIGSTLKRRKV